MLPRFGAGVYIHLLTCAKTLCKATQILNLCACIILANSQHKWERNLCNQLRKKKKITSTSYSFLHLNSDSRHLK